MKWLQIGAAKSGNLWLYHILQSIARRAGLPQISFIRSHPIYEIAKTWKLSFPEQAGIDTLSITPRQCLYRISSILNVPIDDIDDYVNRCSHVWSQSFFCARSAEVLPKFDKVFYIIRDPRDTAVSMSRFSFTPYRLKYFPHGYSDPETFLDANLIETLKAWVRHAGGYLLQKENPPLYFLIYERLVRNFDEELVKLLEYLEVTLEESARQAIKTEVAFETMRSKSPQHVRKGETGQWAEAFSPKQAKLTERLAGPLLRLLRYPANLKEQKEFESQNILPSIPENLEKPTLEKILNHASRSARLEKLKRRLRLG